MVSPEGAMLYMNLESGESRADKPIGAVIVVVEASEEGVEEEHWKEMLVTEDQLFSIGNGEQLSLGEGDKYYQNMATSEIRLEIPVGGFVMIAEVISY
jgi:hypothetical protein